MSVLEVLVRTSYAHQSCYLVVLAQEGQARIELPGRAILLDAGELIVVGPSDETMVVPQPGARTLAALLPAFLLDPWLASRPDATSRPILKEPAAFAADMLAFLQSQQAAGTREMGMLTAAFSRLIVAVSLSGTQPNNSHPDPCLLDQILCHLDLAVRQGQATPTAVARRFGISVRTLHLLFQGEALTFAQTTMRARVRLCALDIQSNPTTSLVSLARRWGFADSSHLSRNLRRHLQVSPRELRQINVDSTPKKSQGLLPQSV